MCYVVRDTDPIDTGCLGGKAAALAVLGRSGLPVPAWFAVTPHAFADSLPSHAQQVLDTAKSFADIQQLVHTIYPDLQVQAAVEAALLSMCSAGQSVAVRSSAIDEDGAQHSFAGQLDSYLGVPLDQVHQRIAAVWRSGFGERVLAYRHAQSLAPIPMAPAVLIQRMVQADIAGVAFSADPVTGQRGIAVIAAVYGLGTTLVSGESDADTYYVDRDGAIIKRVIAEKRMLQRLGPSAEDGVRSVCVPADLACRAALTDQQILAIADLARQASRLFNRPQDIEWAIEDGRLYLLQSRPITSLITLADPDGTATLWDNSNIIESYGGITMPLTFSFANRAYEEVYRQFCRMMRVPEDRIVEHAATFANMLGLIRGRIYYNLLSWYTLLALLPGFSSNRRFMEQMMGVREGLPEQITGSLTSRSRGERVKDQIRLVGTLCGLVVNHMRLGTTIDGFYKRLNSALQPTEPGLKDMRPDELADYYRKLEQQILTRWDAPLINDFFCMVFFGLLRKLTSAWCGDTAGTLHNDLLCNQGGIISAEPAKRLAQLGTLACADPQFVDDLIHAPLEQILDRMQELPGFERHYHNYLARFGDRCLDELKLESATLHDDPLMLLRSVGYYAQRLQQLELVDEPNQATAICRQAEAQVGNALAGNVMCSVVFAWVLKHARARVRDRENLRFERTRLFGRVRRIFIELGRRFSALELLADPRDIFYLEVGEVFGFIEGRSTTTNLKGLVALRKADFEQYHAMPAPDNRFLTYGIVNQGNRFVGSLAPSSVVDNVQIQGLGCCPGRVQGPARIIRNPRDAQLNPGDILVAERTDPGWIMLFTCAAGVLVERGSLLSHSAIVAREMNIPTIVGLAGITQWVKDGDWLELDGSSGTVRRIASQKEAAA